MSNHHQRFHNKNCQNGDSVQRFWERLLSKPIYQRGCFEWHAHSKKSCIFITCCQHNKTRLFFHAQSRSGTASGETKTINNTGWLRAAGHWNRSRQIKFHFKLVISADALTLWRVENVCDKWPVSSNLCETSVSDVFEENNPLYLSCTAACFYFVELLVLFYWVCFGSSTNNGVVLPSVDRGHCLTRRSKRPLLHTPQSKFTSSKFDPVRDALPGTPCPCSVVQF